MKKIFHIYTERNGEMDWFFDEEFNVITYWYQNDANWRGEYMRPLLRYLGGEIIEVTEKSMHPAARAFRKELKAIC
jgi:hypothetical protein